MIKLLVIADDFTGALDTGVKFASKGISTKVTTKAELDLGYYGNEVEVLVIDAETRHCDKDKAYKIVFDIVKVAIDYGVEYIYKKTDSALRGNIGKELEAVLDASGKEILPFIPAFPKMKRVTKKGVHYINNIPIEKSVFGLDPFEPVKHSYIPDIIKEQSNISTLCISEIDNFDNNIKDKTLWVFDCVSKKDLYNIGKRLKEEDKLNIVAGCAGFAEIFEEFLALSTKNIRRNTYEKNIFFVCGSINQVTKKQIEYAEQNGFYRRTLMPKMKLEKGYFDSEEGKKFIFDAINIGKNGKSVVIDTNDILGEKSTLEYAIDNNMTKEEMRVRISEVLGEILYKVFESDIETTFMIAGGDTLLGFMNKISCYELSPIAEITIGSVVSEIEIFGKKRTIITKSGGFGEENLLVELEKIVNSEK